MGKDLRELYDLVESSCKIFDKHENVKEGQTWKYHILPVIKNSLSFARERGADLEVVEVAALFHDYAQLVDFEKYNKVHHIASGELAEPLLQARGFEQSFIEKVKQCIFSHRASVVVDKLSVEEICLADGDAIAHIENVFEMIMWMGYRGDSIEAANMFIKNKIKKSFAKLSDFAKDYIKEKYDAAMKIFY